MRRFRSFSIRKKLLTGNISIILVMVILLGISNYMISKKILTDESLDFSKKITDQLGQNLDSKIKRLSEFTVKESFETDIYRAMNPVYKERMYDRQKRMRTFGSNLMDYNKEVEIRTTPGEHLSADAFWDGDEYKISVKGEMREAALFGENMVLRREISTVYGSNTLVVTDEFENEGFREEPLMLLYHINIGYPFLDGNTRLYISADKVIARDAAGIGHEADYDKMDIPKDNEDEYVFIHGMQADENCNTELLVVNEFLGIGMKLSYNMKYLPNFMEWKSVASGDYVIGLEPANSSVYGRIYHEKRNSVHKLAPFEKEKNVLNFTMLDGKEEISEAICKFREKFKK